MSPTASTRELKQNPAAVIRRALEAGSEGLIITSHGHPTGARIVPDAPRPQRWVSGAVLNEVRGLGRDNAEQLKRDLDNLYADDDYVTDPWERR